MATVIVGAGIIGVSTAYHLLELGHEADNLYILEATAEPFQGASGYAGGFLASNWYSRQMLPLGHLSFSLHRELSDRYSGSERWGYAGSTGISLGASTTEAEEHDSSEGAQDWLLQGTSRSEVADRNGLTQRDRHPAHDTPAWLKTTPSQEVDVISRGDSTAQVDPLRLCQFLLSQCIEKGCHLRTGAVVSAIEKNDSGEMVALRLNGGERVPCRSLVITSGPWSGQVIQELFPRSQYIHRRTRVGSVAGHSIVVRSPRWQANHESGNKLGCHAVFATSFTASKSLTGTVTFAPEIFSRNPDEIYLAGLNAADAALPPRADKSTIEPQSIEVLKEAAAKMLHLNDSSPVQIVREGFCFRPTTSSGRPYIARLPEVDLADDSAFQPGGGVWFSAGHGPWGISLSQGTGRVLAEMILDHKPSINVGPFAV